MCMMYCPNGFVKDENGCEMCRCVGKSFMYDLILIYVCVCVCVCVCDQFCC